MLALVTRRQALNRERGRDTRQMAQRSLTKKTPALESSFEISSSPSSVDLSSRLPRLTSMKLPLLHQQLQSVDGLKLLEGDEEWQIKTHPFDRETSTPRARNHSRVCRAACPSRRLFSAKKLSSHGRSSRMLDQTASESEDTGSQRCYTAEKCHFRIDHLKESSPGVTRIPEGAYSCRKSLSRVKPCTTRGRAVPPTYRREDRWRRNYPCELLCYLQYSEAHSA